MREGQGVGWGEEGRVREGVIAMRGVTVPGWVTVSACRTKGKAQACFISIPTHM